MRGHPGSRGPHGRIPADEGEPAGPSLYRRRVEIPVLRLDHLDGQGVLRTVLAACTEQGWAVHSLEVDRESLTEEGHSVASVILTLGGRRNLVTLGAEIAQLPGVRAARTGAEEPLDEE